MVGPIAPASFHLIQPKKWQNEMKWWIFGQKLSNFAIYNNKMFGYQCQYAINWRPKNAFQQEQKAIHNLHIFTITL